MKETIENITVLKKMGFASEENGWYSLKNGWGFHIKSFPNIKSLTLRLLKIENALLNGKTGLTIDDLPMIKKIIIRNYQ